MDDRKVGRIKDMLRIIDKNVRKIVFKLNQEGFVTFTSSQGSNKELPKFGIVFKSLDEVNEIIALIDTYKPNIWYELSNRWYKEEPYIGSEIDYDNEVNRNSVCKSFDLDWNRCYFLVLKAKTIEEIEDLANFLIEKNNPILIRSYKS